MASRRIIKTEIVAMETEVKLKTPHSVQKLILQLEAEKSVVTILQYLKIASGYFPSWVVTRDLKSSSAGQKKMLKFKMESQAPETARSHKTCFPD